jgi:hypothetical protein
MATVNKDFKVKNGLRVNDDAVIGGTLTAANPTADTHAATKSFVKSIVFGTVASTSPESPYAGKIWVDTTESRMKIYSGSSWITMATIGDTNMLQDHIHDYAIDGDGRIEEVID